MFGYQGYPYQQNYGVPSYMQRPYPTQPQQSPQPQMQPQTPAQMPYEIPIQDVRFVTSEEAKAYIVMPNSKALLIDKSGTAYLKTADNMGQSQTQYFRFEPINADGSPLKPETPTPSIDLGDYIKKEDLEKYGFVTLEQYNELVRKMDKLQKLMEGAKINVATKQPETRMQV